MLGQQIFSIITIIGTASKAIFGPLPYYAVVVMVELMKLVFAFNMAILNASFIMQFFIIFNFR